MTNRDLILLGLGCLIVLAHRLAEFLGWHACWNGIGS